MTGVDLDLSEPEVQLRREAREWLRTNVPERPLKHHDTAQGFEEHRQWEQQLYRGGWAVPGWPRAYGGRDATPVEVLLFEEEYARAGAPARVNQNGLAMLGPTLIAMGSQAQKERYLRPLAKGEAIWAQAWSEPDAGSDLGSLTTRATREGDDYVLRGQKTWVSRGAFADWYFTLARTDPQTNNHHGLTYLLVPRRADGVSTRPIEEMDGRSGFAEVFFDGVRIPAENAVGADGDGWRVAMATLSFERSAFLRPPGRFTAVAERLLELGGRIGGDAGVRRELAGAWAATEAYRLLNLWNAARSDSTDVSPVLANINKLAWSEMDIQLQELALRILGPRGELWEGAPDAEEDGRWARDYLFSLAGTIYAGTSEVQRNLIAERGLGLPRG